MSCFFSIVQFYWLESNLQSRAILKSHRTVHVPIGCHFTFQIPHILRCNFNASKSLLLNANRLWLSLRIYTASSRVNGSRCLVASLNAMDLPFNVLFVVYRFFFNREPATKSLQLEQKHPENVARLPRYSLLYFQKAPDKEAFS